MEYIPLEDFIPKRSKAWCTLSDEEIWKTVPGSFLALRRAAKKAGLVHIIIVDRKHKMRDSLEAMLRDMYLAGRWSAYFKTEEICIMFEDRDSAIKAKLLWP